jgi:hypothetical protein
MATYYNITGYQGDHLQLTLNLKDDNGSAINLDGYDVRGQVRASYGSTGVLLDLNPVIYGNAVDGNITIDISSEASKILSISEHVYDIEKYPVGNPNGNSNQLIGGKFIVLPEVTR